MNETISRGGRQVVGFGECPVVRPEGIYYGGRRVIRLGVGVGALQRTNPLPAGKYWIDVFTPQEAAFQDWLRRNKTHVIVTTTETFDPIDDWPGRTWRLFEVKAPVSWEGPGFPTIAGPGVQSSSDTSDRPAPEKDPTDKLSDYLKKLADDAEKAKNTILWVGVAAIVVVAGGALIYYAPRRSTPARMPAPEPAPNA
jgi:hypothetical protein